MEQKIEAFQLKGINNFRPYIQIEFEVLSKG